MPIFRRSQMGSSSPSVMSNAVESQYWLEKPNLIEFLSTLTWPDGAVRFTGTILVFRDAGLWKCCLKDRDAQQSTFVSAPTLDELFRRCDELLGTGGGEWRSERPSGKKGR